MATGLFDFAAAPREERLGEQARVLRGFALEDAPALREALLTLTAAAPFRQMTTPGGFQMSVAMTACGALGWVTDRHGYRYSATDPQSGLPWPAMPACFTSLARRAAERAGFREFTSNACLVNRYEPGAKMSLHQDKDERDFSAPIVSVSLGLPATFLFGGAARSDRPARVPLEHGDVVVWGGSSRLAFHGVLPVKAGLHPFWGAFRLNLTFRVA
jgi:alkylated DNA repair protein (DNA oxidative demethylase)